MVALADFPLLRFAVLFMLSYALIVFMLRLLVSLIMGEGQGLIRSGKDRSSSLPSCLRVAVPVLTHRIHLGHEARAAGVTLYEMVESIITRF